MSCFGKVERLIEDPILGLPALFNADRNPNKVNLGIGAYKSDSGKPYVLPSVHQAEEILLKQQLDKEYPPIEGNKAFVDASTRLLFADSLRQRDAESYFGVQTVGGTGALRTAADFLVGIGKREIYVSDPTWPNHELIFTYARLKVLTYPYYVAETHGIDFPALCQSLKSLGAGAVVVLHASCHNPTGVDFTPDQWKTLSTLFKQQKLIPFFDIAYQGLGVGLDEDAYGVRFFASQGHEMLVASSCSKNFGLYGERVGMLMVIAQSEEVATNIKSQIKRIVRGTYSVPPLHGPRIVATILQSKVLTQQWKQEVVQMRQRIHEMRRALKEGLEAKKIAKDLSFLEHQKGIFSFIGLTPGQVQQLRKEYAIYMPANGRLNIAGLTTQNIDYVVSSIANVLKHT